MTRQRHGHIFVLSSPSGGGKTTVVERLRQQVRSLARSVSITTRAPRPGERQGREYWFVSREQFLALRRSKQLLEWARVHGAYYGTPQQPVRSALRNGKSIVLSIDVQGARKVRRVLGEDAVLIFLVPPSMKQLERRLIQRQTETAQAIRRRLAAANRELACASWYDHRVINDRLSHAVAQVRAIIMATGL